MREPAPATGPAGRDADGADAAVDAHAALNGAGSDASASAGAPSRILVVDDSPLSQRLIADLLTHAGHCVVSASGAVDALAQGESMPPDLVLLDVLMPDIDGFALCREMRRRAAFEAVPIVMVTSLDAREDRLRGLEAGADDFLSKPIGHTELRARVRSLLRIKRLYDEVCQQRQALTQWSQLLEQRVDEKIRQIERLTRLTRFLPPRLAQRLVAEDREDLLTSHRAEVTVLFADLRGFTAFAESAAPERVMEVLVRFHRLMGELIFQHGGTLERFTGDGMMVFFNDPDPVADHAWHATVLACAMRQAAAALTVEWRVGGGPEGLGLGLSRGQATIGAIGFAERQDYAAIGLVTNRAARLCAEARAGEILVCEHVWRDLAGRVDGREAGALALKGFQGPVRAYAIDGLRAGSGDR